VLSEYVLSSRLPAPFYRARSENRKPKVETAPANADATAEEPDQHLSNRGAPSYCPSVSSKERKDALAEFARFARSLKGDEKSEAQLFLLVPKLQFGHAIVSEAMLPIAA
jgi:hypothetical protein